MQRGQGLNSELNASKGCNLLEDVQYPYAAIPEEDVAILQQIAIGKYPEQIGDKKEIEGRLRKMRHLGVDFPYNAGLPPRERALIYNFDHGVKTDKELAEKLNTSQSNIRGLRASLEKKFEGRGISFQPDRTYTPKEQEFLTHYEKGTRNATDLATALKTNVVYIRFLKGSLIKKGKQIEFQRKPHSAKKRLPTTTGSMSYA